MTSPVQHHNATPYLHSNRLFSSGMHQGQLSYSEAMSQRNQADISFTTSEGDVVTISNYQVQAYALALEKSTGPLQQGMNFTASSLNVDAFNLSVQGDLNDEELADIQNLMADLSTIADQFFSGNLDEAMNSAMNIGDMGSITQLSASFSYQSSWSASTQLADYHPVPSAEDGGGSLTDIFGDLPDLIDQAHTDEMKYAEMLKAQWQQIKEFLEATYADPAATTDSVETEVAEPVMATDPVMAQAAEPVAATDPVIAQASEADPAETSTDSAISQADENIPAARRMMNRMQETIARHPRIAPFVLSLVHEAINNKAENMYHPALFSQKNMLKDNFLQEYSNWMYEV